MATSIVSTLAVVYLAITPAEPADTAREAPLIELGLTTNRSGKTAGDGAFSADVLARSGVVTVLYNCQKKVEEATDAWARRNKVKLIERKNSEDRLHLAFSSNSPPGNFILDYWTSTKAERVDEARISFWFRTLANVRLSGEDMGLEPLGQKLLQAVQCVPHH